jgi:hypothetical protein
MIAHIFAIADFDSISSRFGTSGGPLGTQTEVEGTRLRVQVLSWRQFDVPAPPRPACRSRPRSVGTRPHVYVPAQKNLAISLCACRRWSVPLPLGDWRITGKRSHHEPRDQDEGRYDNEGHDEESHVLTSCLGFSRRFAPGEAIRTEAGRLYRSRSTSKARNPNAQARDERRRAERRSQGAADKRLLRGDRAAPSATFPDRAIGQRYATAAKNALSIEVPTMWNAFRYLPDASNGGRTPRLRRELQVEAGSTRRGASSSVTKPGDQTSQRVENAVTP